MEVKKVMYIISCPRCGKPLLKSMEGTHVEIQCVKCRSKLIVNHSAHRLTVCESTLELLTTE